MSQNLLQTGSDSGSQNLLQTGSDIVSQNVLNEGQTMCHKIYFRQGQTLCHKMHLMRVRQCIVLYYMLYAQPFLFCPQSVPQTERRSLDL